MRRYYKSAELLWKEFAEWSGYFDGKSSIDQFTILKHKRRMGVVWPVVKLHFHRFSNYSESFQKF